MKAWLLVGHRGVGKSTLLRKLSQEFSDSQLEFFSLDREVEKYAQKSISKIFEEDGEKRFRSLEKEVLKKLVTENRVIDIGAGFEGPVPSNSRVLWVKRRIDSSRSQFLNRPGLDGSLILSRQRFSDRERCYRQWSQVSVFLREGEEFFGYGEKQFFKTLFLENENSGHLQNWFWTLQEGFSLQQIRILKQLGLKHFEWRDDMLTHRPDVEPILESRRNPKEKDVHDSNFFDWPLEWGVNEQASILSLHTRKKSFQETLDWLPEKVNSIVKLAVRVDSFKELLIGHRWMMEKPGKRSFLPMSTEGRWSWYRLVSSPHQALNFLRFSVGSAPDQPSLLEVLNHQADFNKFAAILGSPVRHSHTPTYHQNFFNSRNCNIVGVDIKESEFESAMVVLQELGLVAAAVTSPLKKQAAKWLGSKDSAINTLYFDGNVWSGKSTDSFGLEALIPQESRNSLVVWGGGGVLSDIEKVFSPVDLYSSRTGESKRLVADKNPKNLIWAVGAKNFNQKGVFPPDDWNLENIFDLNYSQDSPAIELAHRRGCQYHSGLVMFCAQAEMQQEFWNECGL